MRLTLVLAFGFFLACSAILAQAPQGATGAQATPGGQAAPAGRGAGGRGGQPAPASRVVVFEARPSTIKPGQTTLLVWHVENPAGLTIEPGLGPVVPRSSKQLKPAATTTYTLTTRGPNNTTITNTVTVIVEGTTPVAATAAADQTAARKGIARTPEGKPDFSGVYAFGGGGARGARGNAEPAAGGIARTPTLKPGAEQYRVNRAANPLDTGRTSDCMPLSPPDAFGVPYQFQIVQNKDYMVLLHEYPGTFRIIPLDGEPHQADPDPTWLGDSVGRWEGDTLVIDTIGYNDKTEVSGYRHTDALHTVERLKRIEDGFEYEVTIEDPNVFVGPWMETRTYRLNVPPMKKIMEFICENNRDYKVLFGSRGAQPNR
jgi:hypothetical protein